MAKDYFESGKLWITWTYRNDEVVSGKCYDGKVLNNAEISNYNNGLSVSCE